MKLYWEGNETGVEITNEALYEDIKADRCRFTGQYVTSPALCEVTGREAVRLAVYYASDGKEYRIDEEVARAIEEDEYWDDLSLVADMPARDAREIRETVIGMKDAPMETAERAEVQSTKQGKKKHPKRDVYMETTEKIVELLEAGRIPWQKGWDGKIGAQLVGLPINGKTNRPYTRLNKMFLSMVMAEKESADPRFFTMAMLRQQNKIHQEKVELMKAAGKKYPAELEWEYRVKKGSHSYAVFSHWKVDKDRHGSLLPPEDQYWAKKQIAVFHASDCIRREYKLDKDGSRLLDEDGKPVYEDHPLKEWKPKSKGYTHEEQSEICEAILAASGAKILHDIPRYSDTPCYSSTSDVIHLLPKEAYKDINEYYATALHELCHWTGHGSRMNRELVGERENKELYAKEELRAELASTFLAIDLGIPMNTTNHAAYVQSWVKALKDDKKEIFKASNEAVQIADYVKRFMPERFKEKDETLVSAPEGVIVDAEPQAPATEEAQEKPTDEKTTQEVQPIGDRLTPVDDPSLRTLPLSAQAKETARLYRYFVERVTSLVGSIPTDNLHSIEKHAEDAPYKGGDAIYFEKQLPASVVAKCSMTPDYRYFANKSVHIEIYRQKDDAALAPGSPPFFERDYEKSFEGNYVRTAASSQEMCAKVFSELSQASNDEATVPRPIREGDLIEVDGQLWNVDKAGFTRVQLHPYEDDLVITPLELPEVKEMLAQVEKTVNSESYAVYRQIFRENSYIGAQSDGTLAVHPGAFKATDDAKEGIELEMQKDYARNFRENTFKEGLSIYTPTDEKGWQKLDEDFAARFLIDTLQNGKYDDGRVDADLLKENIYDFVGKAIQENSPYSVISQDAGYGYDRAVAAFSRKEVNEAFEAHQKKRAGNFAEQEKIASQSAPPEEREEDAGRGR